jgi:hypothetical protein
MFINLTNANALHKGNPVAIKKDLIVSVYASTQVGDDNTVNQVTFVFVPPHGTWEVLEPYDQVLAELNET